VHFVGLFLSSLLKMHGPKNKMGGTSSEIQGLNRIEVEGEESHDFRINKIKTSNSQDIKQIETGNVCTT